MVLVGLVGLSPERDLDHGPAVVDLHEEVLLVGPLADYPGLQQAEDRRRVLLAEGLQVVQLLEQLLGCLGEGKLGIQPDHVRRPGPALLAHVTVERLAQRRDRFLHRRAPRRLSVASKPQQVFLGRM
ncbi:hypothetical protein D3C86_756620 [compost metagenome]